MKIKSLFVEILINQDQRQKNQLKNTFIDEQQVAISLLFHLFKTHDGYQRIAVLYR